MSKFSILGTYIYHACYVLPDVFGKMSIPDLCIIPSYASLFDKNNMSMEKMGVFESAESHQRLWLRMR